MEWYRLPKAPIVLGHEISGVVEAAGAGVEGFAVGDRVVTTHHVPCNTCRYCLAGNHTVCETLHTTNFDPGGFAEYLEVPALAIKNGNAVKVPAKLIGKARTVYMSGILPLSAVKERGIV